MESSFPSSISPPPTGAECTTTDGVADHFPKPKTSEGQPDSGSEARERNTTQAVTFFASFSSQESLRMEGWWGACCLLLFLLYAKFFQKGERMTCDAEEPCPAVCLLSFGENCCCTLAINYPC